MNAIKELITYKEMIHMLVRKELRTRYKGSFLGFLWTFLNPLLQLVVYSTVFSLIMRVEIENYAIFLFIALIPWTFFSTALQGGATSVVQGKELLKKIYFPRIVLPLATVSAAFMNMVYSMVVVLAVVFFGGLGLSWYALYLPLIMVLSYIFVLGISILFSALTVYFRDLEHLLNIFVMALFYLTPIVYTIDMVPAAYRSISYFNPMTSIIGAYRDILYFQRSPLDQNLLPLLLWGLVSIVIGFICFNRLQRHFVEEM